MKKDSNLKALLVKILVAQYNQEVAFAEVEKKGVFVYRLLVKNMDIVFGVVGFPEDNTDEYDFRFEMGAPRDNSKKVIDDDCFAKEWLEDYYHEITQELFDEKNLVVTPTGIDVSEGANTEIVSEKLGEYIDWLYEEYDKYKNGEQPWEAYFNERETDENHDEL